MNQTIKNILKKAGLYYTLQGNYRRAIGYTELLFRRLSYLKYKGRGFTCNFCGKQYERFVPRFPLSEDAAAIGKYNIIAGTGENVYCPNCGSTCRERLILQELKENVDYQGKNILHFSPEKKIYDFLKDKATVTTADIEPGFYKLIDKNVQYADATQLQFANDAFDIVIANHIMEHIPNDLQAMKEIYRVLKSGGRAIMQIPFSDIIPATIEEPLINDPAKQSELFGQKDHVRIYTINDYIERLTLAGFTVIYITPEELRHWTIFAIQENEGLVYCRKSDNY